MSGDRPNVLLVVADHHRADALGAVDDSYYTPNLDALVDSGIRFERCYCTTPQCSPARSSLVTGRYPHQTGVQALPNWAPDDRFVLDPDAPSVGRAFRDAGYETAWFGRWDLGAGNVGPLGWDVRDIDLTGTGGKDARDRDTKTLGDSLQFLRGREGDEPFFLTASFNLPHWPYYEDDRFAGRYDRAAVPVPESVDDDLAGKPDAHRGWAERCDTGEEAVREAGYNYRTMVSRVDAYVGHLLDRLREEDLLAETVVVFTGDHGDMLGAHGMYNIHTVGYEEAIRVPLVVRKPDGSEAGTVEEGLVSARSVPGTLAEAAGIDAAFDGGSLYAPESRAATAGGRVFFEHKQASGELHPYRAVRTPRFKYVEYFGEGGVELYDLAADPHEMTNLAGDPAHADTEAELRREVRAWWEETGGDAAAWTEPVPDEE